MRPWLRPLWSAARYGGDALVTLVCWTLWLALGILLIVQVVVAVRREFQVPEFMLRAIEQRVTASGAAARFGRALFDPAGGVLLENLELSLPAFAEPVIGARAVYVELDPWALCLGRVEAQRVHATGVRVMVPAMLASSGRPEPIVEDLDFDVITRGREFDLQYLTTRLAGITVAAHGGVRWVAPARSGPASPVPLLAELAANYAAAIRQLTRVVQRLPVLEDAQLQATLAPAVTSGATAAVVMSARTMGLPALRGLGLREFRLAAEVPLGGDQPVPVPFTAHADEVHTTEGSAERVDVQGTGVLAPRKFFYEPRHVDVVVGRAEVRGFSVDRLAASLDLGAFPRINGRAFAEYGGAPLHVEGGADLADGTAVAEVSGAISPALLTPLSALLHRELRRYIDFGAPVGADLHVRFAPGWKFSGLTGRVEARQIDAYHVQLDRGGGEISFDGRHFLATRAYASIGENLARGSFEQDLRTREFRFLLTGRLRPLDISGWFHDWWSDFFEHFAFPDAPPDASVDVAGRWFAGHETTVFLYAQSGRPTIREATLDYARTIMFIRPNFFDALEVYGTHGAGELRGSFALQRDLGTSALETGRLTFAFDSTIDLPTGARLLGPVLAARVAPFTFERPPQLRASGSVERAPGEEGDWHRSLTLRTRSMGSFSAYGLAGRDLNFDARITNDEILVEGLEASLAGGLVAGRARIWGHEPERRLGFDAYVKDANLNEAISVASNYVAAREGRPAGSPDKFLTGRNDARIDAAVSAEGFLARPFSFRGSGNASIVGTRLGEVRLLGLLSELINFTALRFTAARAEFKLEGSKVVFPSVNVTGANSAIHAHGDYSLERHELDFNARVYPFEESKGLLQTVVGAVLTPFSAVLEVKLTGPLDQPKWAFVIGPTNLFNSLSQPPTSPAAAPPPPEKPQPDASEPKKTD